MTNFAPAAPPAFPDGAVTLPTQLTLTPPAATALTPDQTIAFNTFVQAQETRASLSPSTYVFLLLDETKLNADQTKLLQTLRNPRQCAILNNFNETHVDVLEPGTQTMLTLAQGLQNSSCPFIYSTQQTMGMTFKTVDTNSWDITALGTLTSVDQTLGENSSVQSQIGLVSSNSAMTGNFATIEQNTKLRLEKRMNRHSDIVGTSAATTYRTDSQAEFLWTKDTSGTDFVVNLQMALNVTITSEALPTPVTISLLTNLDAVGGAVTTSNVTAYINAIALNPADAKTLASGRLFQSIFEEIATFEVPFVAAP